MKTSKPLKRYKPVKKKRIGIRRGELTKAEKEAKRIFIYELSGARCELKLPGCKGGSLPWDGSIFERWHLVHMRARRRFGWPIEGEHRMRGGCFSCHSLMHSKSVRPHDLI